MIKFADRLPVRLVTPILTDAFLDADTGAPFQVRLKIA